MRDRDLMNSLKVLLKMNGILFWYGMLVDWVVHLKHLVSFLEDIQSAHCDMYIHQSGIDTSTASGKMMFGMLSVFSEFERSMIRERVIAGQQRAVANGVKLGRKTNVNDGIITAVYHMRQNNVPIKRIAKDLQIGVGTVYKILDKVA